MIVLKDIIVGIGIIASLIAGFLVGLSVDTPRLNNRSVSGTIGKVNNYRNVRVSEADIQLKNDLATDSSKLKALQSYFNFYYVGALRMNTDVDFAVKEATATESFQIKNKSLTAGLENYGKFLLSARTDLLIVLAACKSVKDADPIILRNTLNQGRNVVAQINFRDRIVLEFVDALTTFIKSNKPGQYQGLEKAHDFLMANEVYTAMITNNKPVLKFLDKSSMFSKSQENLNIFDQQKLNGMIQQDMERLGSLRINDSEKLNAGDTEKLGLEFTYNDAQKLGSIASDAEKLGTALFNDTEKLRCDVEKLGCMDAEKLGGYTLFASDAEKLGRVQRWTDAEILGLDDKEMLGHGPSRWINDAENLNSRTN